MSTYHNEKRRFMYKVTTSYRVDDDLCFACHFVWAKDQDEADELVARHGHRFNYVTTEQVDDFDPTTSTVYNTRGKTFLQKATKPVKKPRTFTEFLEMEDAAGEGSNAVLPTQHTPVITKPKRHATRDNRGRFIAVGSAA